MQRIPSSSSSRRFQRFSRLKKISNLLSKFSLITEFILQKKLFKGWWFWPNHKKVPLIQRRSSLWFRLCAEEKRRICSGFVWILHRWYYWCKSPQSNFDYSWKLLTILALFKVVVLGIMTAKSRTASTSASGGLFVRITFGDTQGRVLMNALVWNESFTSADELCANSIFVRGSVLFFFTKF